MLSDTKKRRSSSRVSDRERKKLKTSVEIVVRINEEASEAGVPLGDSLEFANNFSLDPKNEIIRNAVTTVGSTLACTNQDRLNKVSHYFMNTVKKKGVRATNQGSSGRCWMFAALNTLRHIIINGMDLVDFEFSETHLFFWDKYERANTYMQWVIDHPDESPGDRYFDFLTGQFGGNSDGGWHVYFQNLVEKYGLVPKESMKESFQTSDSNDMNNILKVHITSFSSHIVNNRGNLSVVQQNALKKKTLNTIYNILVKFMGTPPTDFVWSPHQEGSEEVTKCEDLTPLKFKSMVTGGLNMFDFSLLADIPSLERNRLYTVKYSSNLHGGRPVTFLNVDSKTLSYYTVKSIVNKMSVWFAADVSRSFNMYNSTLDDSVNDHETLFGKTLPFSKGDQLKFGALESNHALTFTGVDIAEDGKTPVAWQVENSWGYFDNGVPGLDGFPFMSQSWFEKNVMQVCIFNKLINQNHSKMMSQEPIVLEPWSLGDAALRVSGTARPRQFNEKINNFHTYK
jgi:bleomycin hydrolase